MKRMHFIFFSGFMLWSAAVIAQPGSAFKVTIENISEDYEFLSSGVANTPILTGEPGLIESGRSFMFSFTAPEGSYVSFATMFAQSNDLFFAPGAGGIALYGDNNTPVTGDITDQLMLWDAGTEANQEPGVGVDQAPRQADVNTGDVDPDNTVRLVSDDFTYPPVEDVIRASIFHAGGDTFEVHIENVSSDSTLSGMYSVPLSPGAWAVHTGLNPLFTPGSADTLGLERLAEDGNPADLNVTLALVDGVMSNGIFDTPIIAEEDTNLIVPGQVYEFKFGAREGAYLSFATMFAQSNDLFFAPGENGIPLYNENGVPLTGDITYQLDLWDAGTEANQEPGVGADQAPRQGTPNVGEADPDTLVRPVSDNFTYPAIGDVISAKLLYAGEDSFMVRISNVSSDTTLSGLYSVPLSPVVWVIHTEPAPLFTAGEPDRGLGLEALAEDGDPTALSDTLSSRIGVPVLLSPGLFVISTEPDPIFTAGEPDRGLGLEALAEDGDPTALTDSLKGETGIVKSDIFMTDTGSVPTSPLMPGETFEFIFMANPGEMLSFATMYGQSNDVFFATDGEGIPLFGEDDVRINGDVTSYVQLWDAGTEMNQEPGSGMDQAPRQSAPNTGEADSVDTVRLVSDGYTYPDIETAIKVTISPIELTEFRVRIENVSTSTTLTPSDNSTQPIPLSPGVWAVHTLPDPIFTVDIMDKGQGLEHLAEDGDPAQLDSLLQNNQGVFLNGLFDTPVGSEDPSPISPGEMFEFSIYAVPGTYLSFASMFAQSNDLFFAPSGTGIALFDENDDPVVANVTSMVSLWDAGTEANQEPGVGADQAPRQSAPNTGTADPDTSIRLVSDDFTYPEVSEVIRVSIFPPGVVAVEDKEDNVPDLITLEQNFPNPFNPSTTIDFYLPSTGFVNLTIYNQVGQEIRKLVDSGMRPGSYKVIWDGTDENGRSVSSGLYMYRLKAGNTVLSKKMLLIK